MVRERNQYDSLQHLPLLIFFPLSLPLLNIFIRTAMRWEWIYFYLFKTWSNFVISVSDDVHTYPCRHQLLMTWFPGFTVHVVRDASHKVNRLNTNLSFLMLKSNRTFKKNRPNHWSFHIVPKSETDIHTHTYKVTITKSSFFFLRTYSKSSASMKQIQRLSD